MASNNAINTELVGSIVNGLKSLNMYVMPENIFYVDFRQMEYTNIIKSMFFN